jgi:uncharacterized lipoprotein YbaY
MNRNLAALALALALSGCDRQAEGELEPVGDAPPAFVVTGTISLPADAALPPGAILDVALLDLSAPDAEAPVVAAESYVAAVPPVRFELVPPPDAIEPDGIYAVTATVQADGQLLFANGLNDRVPAGRGEREIDLVLSPADAPPSLAEAETRIELMRRGTRMLDTVTGAYTAGDASVDWTAWVDGAMPVVVDEDVSYGDYGEGAASFYFSGGELFAYRESGRRRVPDLHSGHADQQVELLAVYDEGAFVEGRKTVNGEPADLQDHEKRGPLLQAVEVKRRIDAARGAPMPVSFRCEDGSTLEVVFDRANETAEVTTAEPATYSLMAEPTGSGFAYGDAVRTLRGKGQEVRWTDGEGETVRCVTR